MAWAGSCFLLGFKQVVSACVSDLTLTQNELASLFDVTFLQEWISSYLSERKQAVWINNCFSPLLEMKVGGPQGSSSSSYITMIFSIAWIARLMLMLMTVLCHILTSLYK